MKHAQGLHERLLCRVCPVCACPWRLLAKAYCENDLSGGGKQADARVLNQPLDQRIAWRLRAEGGPLLEPLFLIYGKFDVSSRLLFPRLPANSTNVQKPGRSSGSLQTSVLGGDHLSSKRSSLTLFF